MMTYQDRVETISKNWFKTLCFTRMSREQVDLFIRQCERMEVDVEDVLDDIDFILDEVIGGE